MEEENKALLSERNRYRSSFSATVLFSGVQIYQILIRIIKSKFIALLIGPAGMGIASLLRSTTDTVSAATNMGLNTSSVKTIAAASREGNNILIAKNVIAQRRLIWITGLVGMIICAAFAAVWSQVSFGDNSYVWSFVIVSSVVLFDQLNKGELALLQGMQQRKKLARANVLGQTLNAIITIPLFYFWGINAIVASLVLGSLISLLISLSFSRRLELGIIGLSWKETFSIGREMINLGFFLSLQSLLSLIIVWIIRNYVSKEGGLDEVGLYSAGTTIITSYIGLVFTAIATDYFPRLAATKNNEEMESAVRTQAELTILLLTPLVVAFLVYIKPIIILLYSTKFLPIEYMMYWSVGGVLIQAIAWALSHTLLAKAKPSLFFMNELIAALWSLPIRILCYKWWGLTGFGIATVLVYIVYLLQIIVVTKKIFKISYEKSVWRLFAFLNLIIFGAVLIKLTLPVIWGYIGGSLIFLMVGLYVFVKLDKKMDLKTIIASKVIKNNGIFSN